MSKSKDTLYPDVRTFVERQIRWYHENKRQLETLEMDLFPSIISQYGHKAGGGSDPEKRPTEDTAIKIASDIYVFQLGVSVNAVREVYESLPDIDKELIRLKYWDRRLTADGIAMRLGISRPSVYVRLNKILAEVAKRMGYINF